VKPNHQRITVDVPAEDIVRMLPLNKGNRTTTVTLAIKTYLDIQGRPVNRYGVDCDYLKRKMLRTIRDMEGFTPLELRRTFLELEAAVRGEELPVGADETV
jgi:hypothetical protein